MTYIKYNKFDALIAGDVEGDAQLAGKKINTDVLLVPHHGSNYTSSSAFISRYDPEAIVISTDGHKYGHPSQQQSTVILPTTLTSNCTAQTFAAALPAHQQAQNTGSTKGLYLSTQAIRRHPAAALRLDPLARLAARQVPAQR